jgi:23S rRNA (adenine2030-N6)-methyltransferase
MNYRHGFHAGNFADVVKHAVLARVLVHIRQKDAAFRLIDTHAGAGSHSLASEEAERTGEWRDGIGRILGAALPADVESLLEPWLVLVRDGLAGPGRLYPGSPALARHLARPQDRILLCEKHPDAARDLQAAMRGDKRVKVVAGDGWRALPGLLPPPERRGLVLIDPPFEAERELDTVASALEGALRRWPTGIFLAWYPIKGRRPVERFARQLAGLPAERVLRVEIDLYKTERIDRLNGCGVAVIHPTWRLDDEMTRVLAAITPILARDSNGRYRVEWLKSS